MDRNNIYLSGYGGVGRGNTLPPTARHGELFIWYDNFEPKLMQWDDILKIWKPAGGEGEGVNGGVFFIDAWATSSGNVGSKEYTMGDITLNSIVSDTDNITFKILAITGHTNYKPIVKIGQDIVSLAPISDRPLFEGNISLNVNGLSELTVVHEDGAKHKIKIIREDIPNITSATFVGNYPSSQTELKENDKMGINIQTDSTVIKVRVEDFGACKFEEFVVNGNNITVQSTIANRGNSSQFFPAKIKVQKPSGSWSNVYITNTNGNTEKVNVVKLNNAYPTFTLTGIVYPLGQMALKDNELATVKHTLINYDEVTYSSPNGQILISNINNFETDKIVQRISGDYNVTSFNFRAVAKKSSNGAVTTFSQVINIAHMLHQINIVEQEVRFRSSPSGSNYWIRVVSNQRLSEKPTLAIPHGTWVNDFTTSDMGVTWTRTIKITDSDLKGTFNYLAMSSKNLAGKENTLITGDDTYTIGGFVTRNIVFPPFIATMFIGCKVTNVSKLEVIDMSGNIYTYQNSFADNKFTYTIVNSVGSLDSNGDYIRLTDLGVVNANSLGTYNVNIQEVI